MTAPINQFSIKHYDAILFSRDVLPGRAERTHRRCGAHPARNRGECPGPAPPDRSRPGTLCLEDGGGGRLRHTGPRPVRPGPPRGCARLPLSPARLVFQARRGPVGADAVDPGPDSPSCLRTGAAYRLSDEFAGYRATWRTRRSPPHHPASHAHPGFWLATRPSARSDDASGWPSRHSAGAHRRRGVMILAMRASFPRLLRSPAPARNETAIWVRPGSHAAAGPGRCCSIICPVREFG